MEKPDSANSWYLRKGKRMSLNGAQLRSFLNEEMLIAS